MTLLDVKDRLLDGGALEDGLVGDGGASGPRHLRDIRLDLIRMTNVLSVLINERRVLGLLANERRVLPDCATV